MPIKKAKIDTTTEDTTTDLKVLNTLIEVRAGKIIKLDINIAPIILIPKTIVMAVKKAIRILYIDTLTPVALAKLSSKVTENI